MLRRYRALRKAAKFIARFEGGQSPDGLFWPYWDSAGGVWTQGYGHTGSVSSHAKPWTRRKALRILRKDAKYARNAAEDATDLKLSVNQLAALTSFGFNLGTGYFYRGHTIGNALHAGKRKAIAEAFLLYDKAGGETLTGLTRRRRAERRLFLRKS